MTGIYQIWIGDNFYIGRSKNLAGRTSGHLRALKLGKHGNERMQRAYNKHQMFEWYPLVECTAEACIAWEQAYIDDNIQDAKCMNMNPHATDGGWDFLKGKPISAETRLKMSLSGKGKHKTAETRLKMSESNLGKNKGKIANNKGKRFNKLTRKYEVIL